MTDRPDYTNDFDEVAASESEWIERRREAAGVANNDDTVGLALSGGGIRSATFNLGLLMALGERNLLKNVDYLSSVSGGGYIAACLTWLLARLPGRSRPFTAETEGAHGSVQDWLRAHGKYLVAEYGFSGWTLGASILAATLLNLLVMLPPLLLVMGAATLEWVPVNWPAWLPSVVSEPVRAHDGFVLMTWTGIGALLAYLGSVLVFASVSSFASRHSHAGMLRVRRLMGFLLNAGIAMLAVGLLPIVVAVQEAMLANLEQHVSEWLAKLLGIAIPIGSGLAAMRRADTRERDSGKNSRTLATVGLALVVYGLLMFGYHLVVHAGALESRWIWGAAALSLALATWCDVNQVSMHSYYRARLAKAFMPPVAAGADRRALERRPLGFRLTDCDAYTGAPLHLINTTLNTTSSHDEKNRARGGASFFFSPLYCGSAATGFRSTASYDRGEMALSTAFTISGAAVDPNTAETRSRPIAFLMALLNFRLGFWAANPAFEGTHLPLPWWYVFVGREMLGHGLDERRRNVHLSDGGQFDNLGLYELLRRRCRHIIVSDAGADPDTTLSDLGLVIQRARDDFGAQVDICGDHLWQQAQQSLTDTPFAVGHIRYADGTFGRLLYIKPLMRSGLTADVYAYWRQNPDFPNQSTANQFFGEQQFSAYQALGRQIVDGIAGEEPVESLQALIQRAASHGGEADAEAPAAAVAIKKTG
ncbi:MAG: hypothetical protein AAFN78_04275 [Pseudomonadota bacterium]